MATTGADRAVTVPPDGKRRNSRLIFELQGREANQRQVIKKILNIRVNE